MKVRSVKAGSATTGSNKQESGEYLFDKSLIEEISKNNKGYTFLLNTFMIIVLQKIRVFNKS